MSSVDYGSGAVEIGSRKEKILNAIFTSCRFFFVPIMYIKSPVILISVYTGKYEIPGVEGPVLKATGGKR